MKGVLIGVGVLMIGACAWPHPNLNQSRQICDIDSLATKRSNNFAEDGQLRAVGGFAHSITDLSKMQSFKADIDAQYRTTVASCEAYMACMDRNAYDTRRCGALQIRWQNSEDTFLALSKALDVPPPMPTFATGGRPAGPKVPVGPGGALPPVPIAGPFTAEP